MNSVSIYEKRWLDLVFEGKNKSYGAYRLRLENQKTTLFAFFIALLLVTSISLIPMLVNYLSKSPNFTVIEGKFTPIVLTDISPKKPKTPTQAIVPIKKEKTTEVTDKKQLVDPIIVNAIDANDIAKNIDNTPRPNSIETTGGIPGKNPVNSEPGTNSTIINSGNEIETSISLDKQPQFPGGMGEFSKFIGRNFNTPNIDEQKTLKVYVTFVIEKDGSLTDIKILRDPGYELGAEAVRVLKLMKIKWEPGMIAGNPGRTAYTLPITIKME